MCEARPASCPPSRSTSIFDTIVVQDGSMSVWSHPLDLHYSTTTIHGWPKFHCEVRIPCYWWLKCRMSCSCFALCLMQMKISDCASFFCIAYWFAKMRISSFVSSSCFVSCLKEKNVWLCLLQRIDVWSGPSFRFLLLLDLFMQTDLSFFLLSHSCCFSLRILL